MSERFTLYTGPAPQAQSAAPDAAPSARFTPYTGGQSSGGARFSPSGGESGGGYDALGALQTAIQGLQGGTQGLSFLNNLGGSPLGNLGWLQQGLGGIGSGISLANNIQQGNPVGAASDVYGAYNSLSSLLPNQIPSTSSLLGIGSGAGADAAGLAGSEAGIGLGGGEALGGGSIGGLGSNLAGGALGALQMYAILGTLRSFFGDQNGFALPFNGQNRAAAAIRDTRNVRRDFKTAEGQVEQGGSAYDRLASGTPVTATDLQTLQNAWSGMGGPALSQFFGTSGGAQHSSEWGGIPGIEGPSMDALLAKSRTAQDKSYWGLLAAMDQAARSGQSFSNLAPLELNPLDALKRGVLGAGITDPSVYANGPTPTGSLGSMLWGTPGSQGEQDMYGNWSGATGGTGGQAPASFVQQFTPGNYLNAVTQFLQPYNANLGSTPFGQYTQPFQQAGATTTPEQQQNMARVAALWQAQLADPSRNTVLPPDAAQFAYMNPSGGGGG